VAHSSSFGSDCFLTGATLDFDVHNRTVMLLGPSYRRIAKSMQLNVAIGILQATPKYLEIWQHVQGF